MIWENMKQNMNVEVDPRIHRKPFQLIFIFKVWLTSQATIWTGREAVVLMS